MLSASFAPSFRRCSLLMPSNLTKNCCPTQHHSLLKCQISSIYDNRNFRTYSNAVTAEKEDQKAVEPPKNSQHSQSSNAKKSNVANNDKTTTLLNRQLQYKRTNMNSILNMENFRNFSRDLQASIDRNVLNPSSLYTLAKFGISNSPDAPKFLGVAGLIPFVAPSALFLIGGFYSAPVGFAQSAYAATILSFLGGVRWGLGIKRSATNSSADASTKPPESSIPFSSTDFNTLNYSVIPSLLATSFLLLPPPLSHTTLALGLAAIGLIDASLPGYPKWFKGLRLVLTLGACSSLFVTMYCYLRYANRADPKPVANTKSATTAK